MAETSTAISAEGRVRSMMNWKETKCGKCKIQRKRPVCNSCFSYDKFIPITITNADRIRSMSDEELTEFIVGLNDHCLAGIGLCDCSKENKSCSEICESKTRKWLQSEVEG